MIGEPSGTAGAPMLNILQKNNLCNALIIVTRYFGGILLGTGGLVRCYSAGCLGAIEKVETIEIEPGIEMTITLDYPDFQNVQYYFGKNGINILDSKYENDIECVVEMSILTKEEFLADVKNRNINIKKVESASSMLQYSKFNDLEISEMLGFSSQSYFIKVFKKYTGMTPKEYKSRYRFDIL